MTEHVWKQDYIIVRRVKTEDGVNPLVDSDDRIVYRETEHPLAAMADFEKENAKLKGNQKMKITVVRVNEQITKPAPKAKQKEVEVEEVTEVKEPAKRGPKPKQNDLD